MLWLKERKGFTLVEIMIVVAIIGLLVAIAIPNFLRAREQAAAQACRANLRQLNAAVMMYRIDNNNAVPPDLDPSLNPYIKVVPTTDPLDGAAYALNAANGDVTCPHGTDGTIPAHL